ncbi:methyltransferase domain-containing protein [Kribbella solani]|uniref:SAM-dependent methyltransferase n=1 Tax=Kribbella solani TaxID=236067 RepID=A0A841DTU8_9ACTN|nr:methyltransferase domain-containing protein [Kribbella solani]MBB5982023.1 SAM-dependent methyltransferase [Kribbella solani]MDX2972315.1 methyltransferase domain-containing protein [Kribbella solani]MDX3001192.1 methyltransferase domain-containing protein [Kribbella solani]
MSFLERIEEQPGAAELRAASYRLLALKRGATCVDVGCGAGHAVAELGRKGLKVTGVDADPEAVEAARVRAPGAMFHVARSDELPVEDESMDGYRALRLFHLLDDPAPTVAEARRVLRPGGRIVVGGQDYGFLMLDGTDQDLTDVVLLGLESRTAAPRAARGLRALLIDHGFGDVEVVVHTEVVTDHRQLAPQLSAAAAAAVEKALITQEDADGWLADQARRGRRDRFLAAIPTLLVAANA